MDIKQLARKPQLVEVTLDDEDLVKTYGEPITFWMMDYVDINTYFDFFKSQSDKDADQLNVLMRRIILRADGTAALGEDEALPIDIAVGALTKINETLGKSKTKPLIQKTGEQQD